MTDTGPLDGLRVVELASEHAAFAGKSLGDLGAEVIVVEPPGGHRSRLYGPFVDDHPDPEGSLWWWHYNTSKLGVTLDLDGSDAVLFRRLVASADIVLEGEPPGRLAALALDYFQLRESRPELIWASITPFGRDMPRSSEQAVDLTVLAGGGSVWSCGYDDHTVPPVRGGGNQGYQTACLWAVMGILTAVLHRQVSGTGQLVDVNMHAASNVTTELGSYAWLVARETVQRQTCRHAMSAPTMPTTVIAADGREVNTGVPPRTPAEFQSLLDWLDDLGLRESFDEAFFLEMGAAGGDVDLFQAMSRVGEDAEAAAIVGAAREAMGFIASRMPAYDFFIGGQRHGLTCGIIYAPEEVLGDPHFRARGFPVDVEHAELGRSVPYPGAPFIASASPWRISRRAPRLGEHNDRVLGSLR